MSDDKEEVNVRMTLEQAEAVVRAIYCFEGSNISDEVWATLDYALGEYEEPECDVHPEYGFHIDDDMNDFDDGEDGR